MATSPSLFGANPEDIQQQRAAALNAEALQYAKLDPFQRATMGIYKGANQLGGAIGGMLGGQDPQLQKATALKQLASQFDTTTPKGLGEYARALNKAGFNQEAMQAAQASQAGLQQSAELSKTQAELGKLNTAAERETLFRNELSKLGPSPTQEAILGATVKYGSPDRVLAVVQGASDKEAARAQALEIARVNADARVAAAQEAGANRLQIAQIAAESRAQIAQLTAALKGEKPLTEYQGKALTFGTRAADANNVIKSLEGKYNTLSSSYLPSFLNSTEGQRVQQAQRNFVNAVLRQESGAAIASSEFDNAAKQYFPQPGDKPEVLVQKRQNRERVIKGFTKQAGPGGKDIEEAFNTPIPSLSPSPTSGATGGWGIVKKQ
jgi:hypothetical protein